MTLRLGARSVWNTELLELSFCCVKCLYWSCASKNDLNCTCVVQLGTLEGVTVYSQTYSWAACNIQGTVCPKGCLYFADNHINSATRGQKTACCVFVVFFFNDVVINMSLFSQFYIFIRLLAQIVLPQLWSRHTFLFALNAHQCFVLLLHWFMILITRDYVVWMWLEQNCIIHYEDQCKLTFTAHKDNEYSFLPPEPVCASSVV